MFTMAGSRHVVAPDEIAKLCYEHFDELPRRGKPEPGREWTPLAAVVKMSQCANSNKVEKEVVSLGTGTKCIGQTAMSPKGDVLNDSHAEVIARRGCIRYLIHELHRAVTGKGSSVYCQSMHQGKWRLQPGISFLLFISHTPCGDASIIPVNGSHFQPSASVTSIKNNQGTDIGGLKRKAEVLISVQNFNRPTRGEKDTEETKQEDILMSKRASPLPTSLSKTGDECPQNTSAKTHQETILHSSAYSELARNTSSASSINHTVCESFNSPVYDTLRTGAKSVPGGLTDPLQPGLGYHSTGLLRVKPGRGEPTLSLSCSDKMARWGVVGFQGALLSHYLEEALYFSTVVVGKCPFSQDAMQRALITRLNWSFPSARPRLCSNTSLDKAASHPVVQLSAGVMCLISHSMSLPMALNKESPRGPSVHLKRGLHCVNWSCSTHSCHWCHPLMPLFFPTLSVEEIQLAAQKSSMLAGPSRRRRSAWREGDPTYIDAIGIPRGVPDEYKLANQIAAGICGDKGTIGSHQSDGVPGSHSS
ncbi:tRNA-specific adenosine deaminase 1 isoform X3 [Stigmatopora argus]